ncbi:MAG: inosine/xanthosine triphosphatase [Planctomycetota bacterium]|jgi:non-canonical (house-cleaning) NTP pyrophosphatase|nr:inosine/xanthosine triphosphatase [Planctomycetota bacterium]
MIIRLGSTNPVKVRATQKAFRLFWPKSRVIPISVTSAVSEHPSSLREIARGARSRARLAGGESDFIVGIEAGTFRNRVVGTVPHLITLAYITDGKKTSFGGSPFFPLEDPSLIHNAGPGGAIAALTKKKITREGVTKDAVVMALAPWLG